MRLHQQGADLAWLIVTGVSEETGWAPERVQRRDSEVRHVAKAVGFSQIFDLRLPPTQLDTMPLEGLVKQFSAVFESFRPEQVFLPSRADAHTDHRVVFDAVAACTKWFRHPSVRRVLAYETISETGFGLGAESCFCPNYFVDISAFLERKLEIMAIYETELGDFPFPRSLEAIRALAAVRGAAAGFKAAEAFQLLRERY